MQKNGHLLPSLLLKMARVEIAKAINDMIGRLTYILDRFPATSRHIPAA